ncbi:SWR1 complex subunit 6 isoform X2 [Aristolochia californica]|uniref:SWR1 complex subunit 6 isoform X2 n=1 Tax=Aristolochia californica TaxID=171875 RepID=UPI0035D98189
MNAGTILNNIRAFMLCRFHEMVVDFVYLYIGNSCRQGYIQKRQSKSTKRKTRQAKALENAKKAPRTFVELLQDANLETLPPYVPSYLRATVGPPSSTSRRHFCTVCGYAAKYTCVRCGVRFCSSRCQVIHNDTRCLKFVA